VVNKISATGQISMKNFWKYWYRWICTLDKRWHHYIFWCKRVAAQFNLFCFQSKKQIQLL